MGIELLIPAVGLALLIAVYVYAKDSAVVAGKIVDAHKQPAAGTEVRIDNEITYTDPAGRFQFADIPFGNHVLSIRHGPAVKERSIDVRTHSFVLYETIGYSASRRVAPPALTR